MKNLYRKLELMRRRGDIDDETIKAMLRLDKTLTAMLGDLNDLNLKRLNRRYVNEESKYSLVDLKG